MFKILAGATIIILGFIFGEKGNTQSSNFAMIIGIASIGAGLDTLFFNKK